jgi:signal transduction histidine kinase
MRSRGSTRDRSGGDDGPLDRGPAATPGRGADLAAPVAPGKPSGTPAAGADGRGESLLELPDPAIARAALTILQQPETWAADTLDTVEANREIGIVARAVTLREPAACASDRPAVRMLRRHLLELLRAETIRRWRAEPEPPDPAELLATLDAFEAALGALGDSFDRSFRERLASYGGADLLVGVAHDFRSPLTSIMFLAETLRRGQSGPITELQRQQLGIIYAAALGLTTVASDVIEIARDGSAMLDHGPLPFSVGEVFEGVRRLVAPMVEEKAIELRLVPPDGDQRVGYPVLLSRVLLNLTTNAIRFTDTGHVEMAARANGPRSLEFSVEDTGRGLSADAIANLYQPFRRNRTERGFHFSGTGLGLAISRRLVEDMGGTLRFDTAPGRGTRFYFDLHLQGLGGR